MKGFAVAYFSMFATRGPSAKGASSYPHEGDAMTVLQQHSALDEMAREQSHHSFEDTVYEVTSSIRALEDKLAAMEGAHRTLEHQHMTLHVAHSALQSKHETHLKSHGALLGAHRALEDTMAALGQSHRLLQGEHDKLKDECKPCEAFRIENQNTLKLEGWNLHIVTQGGRPIQNTGNLIVGPFHHWERASNSLVAGYRNTAAHDCTFVAGMYNEVSGDSASVLGGQNNGARAKSCVVIGGHHLGCKKEAQIQP